MKLGSLISLLILFVLVGCKNEPAQTPTPTSIISPTPMVRLSSVEGAISTPEPTLVVHTITPTPLPHPTPIKTIDQLPNPNTPVPLPSIAVEGAKSLLISFEIEGQNIQVKAINMTFGPARTYIADPDQFRIKLKGSSGQVLGEIRTWDPRAAFVSGLQDDNVGGAWNREGNRILAWANGLSQIWDVSGGQPKVNFPEGGVVEGAAWKTDGSRFLSWVDNQVRIWDASTGELLLNLTHDARVKGAAWNANGSQILSWTADTVLIWDASNGQVIHTLPHEDEVIGAAWDNTGNRILSVSGNTVKVWQAASGNLMFSLSHDSPLRGAAWNAGGSLIMSWDDFNVNVWTLGPRRLLASFPQEEMIKGAAWIGNSSTRILSWAGNSVRAWNVQRGNEFFVRDYDKEVNGAVSDLDGKRILTWSGNLVYVSYPPGPPPPGQEPSPTPEDLPICSKKPYLPQCDNPTLVWNVNDGSFLTLPHAREVKGAAWNKSQDRILSWDVGSVHVWDAANGELLFTPVADDGVDTVFVEKYSLNENAKVDLVVPFIPGLTSLELTDVLEKPYALIDLRPTIQAFCAAQTRDEECSHWLDEMHSKPTPNGR